MRWKLVLVLLFFFTILTVKYPLINQPVPIVAGIEYQESLINQLETLDDYSIINSSAPKPRIYAKNYLLLDYQTNEILVGSNVYESVAIASTTKMMTSLVVKENLDLQKVVTISKNPPLINGSKIGLKSGEKITVLNLLKGLLIYSGNDTAIALAEEYSGSTNIKPFIDKMNLKAQELGLKQTHYLDPAGLDDEGRSNAFELSQVTKNLLEDPLLAKIVSTPETTVSSQDGQIIHQLKNSNRLILPDSPYFMSNALGVKTGFTLAAGHCLVSAININNRLYIGVVLNTTESTITASAAEMNKLFRWAENNLELKKY